MVGYLSSFFYSKKPEGEAPAHPQAPIAADPTILKTQAASKNSLSALGSWVYSKCASSPPVFANEKEAECARILVSPLPKKISLFSVIYALLKQVFTQLANGKVDPALLAQTKEKVQQIEHQEWEAVVEMLSGDEKTQALEALQKLPEKLEKISPDNLPTSDQLFEDMQLGMAFNDLEVYRNREDSNLLTALTYLQKTLRPYIEKNEAVSSAFRCLVKKLEDKNYQLNAKETSILREAIKYLHAKECPQDAFLKVLDSFLRLEAETLRQEASLCLWTLHEELNQLSIDEKIAEKIRSFPFAKDGLFLPEKVVDYLKALQMEGLFNRFENKENQLQELFDLNKLLSNFLQPASESISKHDLFSALEKSHHFLLNPDKLPVIPAVSARLAGKAEGAGAPPADKSSSQGSLFSRLGSAVQSGLNVGNLTDQLAKAPSQELENTGHILRQIIRELENFPHHPKLKQLKTAALEQLISLKEKQGSIFSKEAIDQHETGIIDALILSLSQSELPPSQLLSIVKLAQKLIDKEISLQLNGAPKIVHNSVNELQQGLIECLDECEIRIQKYLRPIFNALGINPFESDEIEADPSHHLEAPGTLLLDNLSGFLSQMLTLSASKAGTAFSQKLGVQVATGSRMLLTRAKNQLMIKNEKGEPRIRDKKYQPIVDALDHILPLIDAAENSGDFNALWNVIDEGVEKIRGLPPIYVNRILVKPITSKKVPLAHAFSPYADEIAKDEIALQEPKQPEARLENFEKITDLRTREFVHINTALTVMEIVYEKICGIQPDRPSFYSSLLGKAQAGVNNDQFQYNIQKLFFEEMDALHKAKRISLIRKVAAKFTYKFISPLIEAMFSSSTTQFIKIIRDVIIKNDKKGFEDLKNASIENFTNFLGILSTAYNAAQDNKLAIRGALKVIVNAELQRPESNEGLAPKTLYQAVSGKAAEKFFPKLELRKILSEEWEKNKFPEDSLLHKAMNVISLILITPIYMFFIPVEWGVNKFLKNRVKSFLINNDILENLLNKNLGSIGKKEYIYAINSVIAEQLKKVLQEIKKNYTHKLSHVTPAEDDIGPKKKLTTLVTYLLEVLDKSKNLTTDQLRKSMESPSYNQKFQDTADSFLIPDVTDSTTHLIKTTYDSIMNPLLLEEHLSNFLFLINESYKTGKKVTDQEMQSQKIEISSLIDQILENTISEAINKKFDFSIEKETKEMNDLINSLKEGIHGIKEAIGPQLIDLRKNPTPERIKKIIKASRDFKLLKNAELFDLRNNKNLDSNMKDFFDGLSQATNGYLKEIDKPLRQILEMQTSGNSSACGPLIEQAINALQKISAWADEELKELKPIDFSISQMKDFKDFTTKTAHERIRERVDGIIELATDPSIDIYRGILHHLFFIPFLKGQLHSR